MIWRMCLAIHPDDCVCLIGAYLLACYDEDDDQYQSVCKVGTGFGDSDLATLYEALKKTVIPEPKNYFCVSDSFKPDVWFEPTMVFEVKCADLSISPNHKVGLSPLSPPRCFAPAMLVDEPAVATLMALSA